MSAADRAADLRAEADALDALAGLESNLAAAKDAYHANPSSNTSAARQTAMDELREARSLTRATGVTVAGDAYVVGEA